MNKEKCFSVKSAFFGLLLGFFISTLFLFIHFELFYNMSASKDTGKITRAVITIYINITLLCAVLGLFWNGFIKTRKRFSLGMALIGTCAGTFAGGMASFVFINAVVALCVYYLFMAAGFLAFGYLFRNFTFVKDAHEDLWRRPDGWSGERNE